MGEESLLDFIPRISPEMSRPDHLGEWCEQIETAAKVGGVRAMCAVPIRHHKTETTSIHGSAYLLSEDPTLRIILMVADHEVAKNRATRIRQVCEAAGVKPARGQNVNVSWSNEEGGGVQVMSAKQSRLGYDVDVLIVDDPLSEHDAYDPIVRERVDMAIAHYTMRAGRTGGRRGSVLIVMSRFHPDDPIGRRLDRKAEKWFYKHSQAINDNGEVFAPDVMSLEEVQRRRREMAEVDPTERLWHSQWQNDPLPDSLGLFRAPKRYACLPGGAFRTIIGTDLSYSPSRHADFFALVVLKVYQEVVIEDGRSLVAEVAYVVNSWRERWDPAQAEQIIRMAKGMYPGGTIYSYMSGPEIGVAHYMAEKGIEIQVMPARYSKRQRAQKSIDKNNAGRIVFPEAAPWVNGFIARMILFTGDDKSGNDDEIDALVSAVDGGMMGGVTPPKTLGKRRI